MTETTKLDPVTFEVLKNAFSTIVDQMAEQILRTCHSFVIYSRDFSSALCDPEGNTIMQGSQDIAVHVGTLHLTARAVVDAFGDDMHEGDVFAINDPYLGGTHFNDVRIVRPIFFEGELICLAESNGHWADMGGSVPGSFDVSAKDHFGEGVRIPPLRIFDRGTYRADVVRMIVSNTRAPEDAEGDCLAQVEATAVAEREILRLVGKYGRDTVVEAFSEVQDYVERLTRSRLSELPDGTWETEDYIDFDPAEGEGLVPIKVKMTIDGDTVAYDLSGSHAAVATFLNSGFGASFSGVVAGTKTFFPDVPLNSGFYRALDVNLGPEGSCVNAAWPTAVTGFCSGPYEKIMSSIFELWSQVMPERAMAAAFNLEYLLVGGTDTRRDGESIFMWYDWMAGGWGGRNGKDGSNATSPVFGVGLAVQPLEGQERLSPGGHQRAPDPARHGRAREVARRLRRREGRRADRDARQRHVLLLRPRALDHVGDRGRPAVVPARRLAQPRHGRRALPRRGVLQRAGLARRCVHPPVRRRRRVRRPAGARSGRGLRGRRRRLRDRGAGGARLRRRDPRGRRGAVLRTRWTTRARRGRGTEIRGARRGWLAEDPEADRRGVPLGRPRRARRDPPPRRHLRLGDGRAAAAHDGAVPGDARAARRAALAVASATPRAPAPAGRRAPRRPGARRR